MKTIQKGHDKSIFVKFFNLDVSGWLKVGILILHDWKIIQRYKNKWTKTTKPAI